VQQHDIRGNFEFLADMLPCAIEQQDDSFILVTTQPEKSGIRMLPLKMLTKPCQTLRLCFFKVEM